MTSFAVPPVPWSLRLVDKLMVPIMFLVRGFRFDSLQETHPWHIYHIDPNDIDPTLTVASHATDPSRYKRRFVFLFHVPLLGGWKQFTVYEVDRVSLPCHIGWVMYDAGSGRLLQAAIQRLPIADRRIRTLDGPPTFRG